jgi:L-lactate utilization protein LutC
MNETTTAKRFTTMASDETVAAVAERLAARNFRVFIAKDKAEAAARVLELIPEGAEVFTAQSATLKELGLFEAIDDSGRYESVRKKVSSLDRATQAREMRKLSAAPDVVVGSVHAITLDGQVVVASYGGSQIAPYVYGAGTVIWVVGSQKIVGDLDEAIERIEKHSLPLESARLQKAMGVPSHMNKVLIVNGDRPGRTSIVIVKEALGF